MRSKRLGLRIGISVVVLTLTSVLASEQALALAPGAIGLRMPFVGPRDILSGGGPGCDSTHQGRNSEAIDYKMPIGTQIFAVEGGMVKDTNEYERAGRTIRISHPAQGTYLTVPSPSVAERHLESGSEERAINRRIRG